jgi:hypothetical protein
LSIDIAPQDIAGSEDKHILNPQFDMMESANSLSFADEDPAMMNRTQDNAKLPSVNIPQSAKLSKVQQEQSTMRQTQISMNNWSSVQADTMNNSVISYADNPRFMNQKPASRNRIVMPHLINKVRIDDSMNNFLSEVTEQISPN